MGEAGNWGGCTIAVHKNTNAKLSFHRACTSQKREDMHMEAYQAYYRDPDEDAYRAGVNYLADKLSGREAAAIKIQVIGC